MGGYGGALKQLSIGCASSAGKAYIHTGGKVKDQAVLWENICPQDAFLEAMADAASTVAKHFAGKIAYVAIMKNLSVDCDCCAVAENPCMGDIGILSAWTPLRWTAPAWTWSSTAPTLAVTTLWSASTAATAPHHQAAEALGVSTTEYELVSVIAILQSGSGPGGSLLILFLAFWGDVRYNRPIQTRERGRAACRREFMAIDEIVSIDEVFMDVTGYLETYGLTARELARKIILDVLNTTGITATAGIGTNLYLCKVAMDIVAKARSRRPRRRAYRRTGRAQIPARAVVISAAHRFLARGTRHREKTRAVRHVHHGRYRAVLGEKRGSAV